MTDAKIDEIYPIVFSARQKGVPVYIFPSRMQGPAYQSLRVQHPELVPFWKELEPIYAALQKRQRPVYVTVGPLGNYRMKMDPVTHM